MISPLSASSRPLPRLHCVSVFFKFCQTKSNASGAAKRAQLQVPPVKPASDSNNNRASPVAGATSRTAKLASIGRAASEAVPSSSASSTSILASQNKTAILRSPINKTHPHTSIFPSSPCTQTKPEHNLNATNVFHANRTDANRRILDEDDDLLSEVQPDAVPTEVRGFRFVKIRTTNPR